MHDEGERPGCTFIMIMISTGTTTIGARVARDLLYEASEIRCSGIHRTCHGFWRFHFKLPRPLMHTGKISHLWSTARNCKHHASIGVPVAMTLS